MLLTLSPRTVLNILTFPGIMVHELAHQIVCLVMGVRVRKVCYLRMGNPSGYVIHDQPSSIWKQIAIGFGPFFINTALGVLLAYKSVQPVLSLSAPAAGYLMVWLGVAVAMHSFPSTGDANAIWRAIWRRGTPIIAKIICLPLVLLIYLGALGSMLWLDLAYGIAAAVYLPYVITI